MIDRPPLYSMTRSFMYLVAITDRHMEIFNTDRQECPGRFYLGAQFTALAFTDVLQASQHHYQAVYFGQSDMEAPKISPIDLTKSERGDSEYR